MRIYYNIRKKVALVDNITSFYRIILIENKDKKKVHFLFGKLYLGKSTVISKETMKKESRYCRFYINGQ